MTPGHNGSNAVVTAQRPTVLADDPKRFHMMHRMCHRQEHTQTGQFHGALWSAARRAEATALSMATVWWPNLPLVGKMKLLPFPAKILRLFLDRADSLRLNSGYSPAHSMAPGLDRPFWQMAGCDKVTVDCSVDPPI